MDRLAHLRAAGGVQLMNFVPAPGSDTLSATKVHMTKPHAEQDMEAARILEEFYKTVESTRISIDRVKQFILDTVAKHSEIMNSVDESKCRALRWELDNLANQINDIVQTSAQNLDTMKKATDKLKGSHEMESHFIGVIRIQENQRHYLTQKLTDAMETYENQQQQVGQRYRSQTERQIKIKYTNLDGTVIDDNTARELAQAVLANDTTNGIFQQSKDVLFQIIETRNDIYRIEQSMRSLNQLFNDLAFLVLEQGEIADVILKNVQQTTSYVEAGHKELKKARKYQKRSRKKLWCLVIAAAILVALFILAGVLGATL